MSSPRHSEQIADAKAAARPLAVLEPALWQRLNEAETSNELATAWLALQCSMISGATAGIVREATSGGFRLLAAWPDANGEPADLRATADLAVNEARAVARGANGGSEIEPSVAYPVALDGKTVAVVAVALAVSQPAHAKDELRGAIRQLQWGSAWLRDHMRRLRIEASSGKRDQSAATLDFIATVLEHERFKSAAMAAATELAIRFDCARVSIGFRRRGTTRLAAISHTAQFGRQMSLVRAVGSAMDEAIDQRASVLYPIGADEALATNAHRDLAAMQHDGQIFTAPLFVVDKFIGAITFERGKDHAFDPETVRLLDVIATAIGPILDEKRRNDRWLVVKAFESLGLQVKRLLGPGYIGRKLAVAGLVGACAFFAFASDIYRVNADAEIEGLERRAVVSAYDGYIQQANARAGEFVKAGDTLATLEDRELSLERLRWVTERQQRVFEHDRALASRQPATINVVKSQIDQADAQLRLIDEQIARTKLTAPFDGMVVSGDLSQRIGGSVSRGETLFEIAPLTDYRVVMQVDERQIASIDVGQTGEVVFTSLPEQGYAVTVTKVTPVAQSREGKNLFQVEGALTGNAERLRPGMIGVAKIDIGTEPLITIWTRPMLDWLRLAAWRWMP
ncbi:HlyD family efflux transporter periplasmic adaptor subunit [Aminobacter sp. HY435]|uniref:HlyD family efflux transporter periplasmic adaptor subunit n=1 Tax=Aminobacter sp. HY435 TaxID=2970917 RepID=UPI0022B96D9A|nr:HlyD family efflux transporter periplasmic adaptor subunit [Aminobacter sp. HY435]